MKKTEKRHSDVNTLISEEAFQKTNENIQFLHRKYVDIEKEEQLKYKNAFSIITGILYSILLLFNLLAEESYVNKTIKFLNEESRKQINNKCPKEKEPKE